MGARAVGRPRAPRPSAGLIVFESAAGRSMAPPRAKTWGWIGQTPVARVRGRSSGGVDGGHGGFTLSWPGRPRPYPAGVPIVRSGITSAAT